MLTHKRKFVVKTSDASGAKVFINMCGHDKVAAPGNWQGLQVPEEVQAALDNVDSLTDAQEMPEVAGPG
ncbi:PIH1 domain-containing protein [Haematococcus lacustris]|uniref:PIH1 domain-containing protein n=1 Tax=Haematococcus lacustris TaxID=44745 RepID=A0A699ZGD1_HAELA|nr:PIH1 domain-containing protein [Haematococcus lacustris]